MKFTAKRADGRAEWRVIYDLVREAQPDDFFSYSDLQAALETTRREEAQRATRRANVELWRQHKRSLSVVINQGYRVLRPEEHEEQATGYQRRSRKQMNTAVMVIAATDLQPLTEAQRSRTLQVAAVFMRMAQAIDQHSKQLAHHDRLIDDLARRINRLEDGAH